VDQNSSVGTATRYGHTVWGSNPGGGAKLFTTVQTGPEAQPASYTKGTGSFLRVKWPGRRVDHPPPSSDEVDERGELYLYSPSVSSWPVHPITLFTFTTR
jgi:hypothetical protein